MKLTRLRRHAACYALIESSEGRQRLQSRLNVPQIDFGLEKRDLVIERDLFDIPLTRTLVCRRSRHSSGSRAV
jgi:hypothetical protein